MDSSQWVALHSGTVSNAMPILITDFDGTFTQRDFFELVLEKFDPPGAETGWQDFIAGKLTLTEGLNAVFTALRTDEAGADELVAALSPAPGTAEAVKNLQQAGWEIVIASAGCGWYIERLLKQQNIEITVHASSGTFSSTTGLLMTPNPSNPYFHPETSIDKPAVVRDALSRDAIVAYAGDSVTDRAAALLVAPERRFATGWLRRQFSRENVPHHHFSVWPEIADQLLATKT